jgi:Abnormal spindle-like microcephaly-assoc'd, ASPM-SPD-2-Hydin
MYSRRICLLMLAGACASPFVVAPTLVAAATFNLTATVTSCTPTCNSFVALGPNSGDPTDAPSVLTGFISLDDAAIADGTWTGADVTGLSFTMLDPAQPLAGPSDPPDFVTDNPITLDQSANGGAIVVANGQPITSPRGTFQACVPPQTVSCVIASAGTVNGTTIDSGVMDLWITQGILAANGAVVHIDFNAGTFTVNIFENLIFVAGGIVGEPRPVIYAPASLTLPDTLVGSMSASDVEVSNVGPLPLVITAVAASPAPFAVATDDCSGQALDPGGSCMVSVSFTPVTAGTVAGTLAISSNDPITPDKDVALSGTGTSAVPDIALGGVGIDARVGRCRNLTTGQALFVPVVSATVPCERAGLAAAPGDRLRLTLFGVAQSASQLAAVAAGMNIDQARCVNRSTGQSVQFAPPTPQVAACRFGGLSAMPGDGVSISVIGTAQ